MIPVIPENFIMSGNWPTLSTAFQGLFRCLNISCHLHSRFSVSGKGHTQDPLRRHFIQHMAALSTTGKKLNIRKKSQKKITAGVCKAYSWDRIQTSREVLSGRDARAIRGRATVAGTQEPQKHDTMLRLAEFPAGTKTP